MRLFFLLLVFTPAFCYIINTSTIVDSITVINTYAFTNRGVVHNLTVNYRGTNDVGTVGILFQHIDEYNRLVQHSRGNFSTPCKLFYNETFANDHRGQYFTEAFFSAPNETQITGTAFDVPRAGVYYLTVAPLTDTCFGDSELDLFYVPMNGNHHLTAMFISVPKTQQIFCIIHVLCFFVVSYILFKFKANVPTYFSLFAVFFIMDALYAYWRYRIFKEYDDIGTYPSDTIMRVFGYLSNVMLTVPMMLCAKGVQITRLSLTHSERRSFVIMSLLFFALLFLPFPSNNLAFIIPAFFMYSGVEINLKVLILQTQRAHHIEPRPLLSVGDLPRRWNLIVRRSTCICVRHTSKHHNFHYPVSRKVRLYSAFKRLFTAYLLMMAAFVTAITVIWIRFMDFSYVFALIYISEIVLVFSIVIIVCAAMDFTNENPIVDDQLILEMNLDNISFVTGGKFGSLAAPLCSQCFYKTDSLHSIPNVLPPNRSSMSYTAVEIEESAIISLQDQDSEDDISIIEHGMV
ncbi:hypothetical protein PCE1_003479 [Barthelona sp. PCE]